jgi:hypothetical protein
MSFYDYTISQAIINLLPPRWRKIKHVSWLTTLLAPVQWLHSLFFRNYLDYDLGAVYTYYLSGAHTSNKGDLVRFVDNTVWECQDDSTDVMMDNPVNPIIWYAWASYNIGNIVTRNGMKYYSLKDTNGSHDPLTSPLWWTIENINTKWIKILDDSIGVWERKNFNCQKMTLEYLLNRYFNPLNGTAIWISKNVITQINFLVGSNQLATSFAAPNTFNQQFVGPYVFVTAGPDFNINIATAQLTAIDSDAAKARAIISRVVDRYNLSGMRYVILTF